MFALTAPIAVYADDEALADEQLLAAQDPDPALAPAAPVIFPAQVSPDVRWAPGPARAPVPAEALRAVVAAALAWDETSGYGSVEVSRAAASALLAPDAGPSWDESSGYGSVEAGRAEVSSLLSGELSSGQDQALTIAAAAARSWDETSGYGSVEASRAAASALLADPGPTWLAASRAAAARRAAPAFPEWDAGRWSPLPLCEATNPDRVPAQLARGQRAESAHLATVPLPGEDAADIALAAC
jgi:hypothetical protein